MNTIHHEFEEDTKSLADLIKIVKRRLPSLVIPTIAIAFIAMLVAFLLPATYRSTATILIEEQEIPREFVTSTITSYAAQQIQVINQRILTVENINRIADKYNLYRLDDGSKLPSTEIAIEFRKDMTLDLVSANVIDPRSGRPTEATIAFTLSYESPNPNSAQRVANELVTLFLDENLRNRTDKAASTAAFLEAEATSLNNELLDLEVKLANFKEDNEGSLPELY
ncbi:MAG: lipopolysaccharide biosynthesis protein, partial [Pseudomonadales bacterium]|nr:lipopolysaccharide biosynthesis protein [Pseudomonadales bacterium]